MNREEAIEKWVIPALKNTWNEKRCNEVLEALEQEPCDSVSREKVLQIVRAWFDRDAKPSELKNEIENLPSVTPAEKVGRWIERFDESGKWYECDQCHTDWGGSVNYCPNCGAKM